MKGIYNNIVFRSSLAVVMALFGTSSQTVLAQTEKVDQLVEVTREYNPMIGGITKLTHTPDISDDVYIRPDIDFTITPIAHYNSVESEMYGVSKVNFYEHKAQSGVYYIKAGAGYPLNAVGDFYATVGNSSEGFVTAFANYEGQYGTIENDFGYDLSARQHLLRSGGYLSRYFGKRTLDASAIYSKSDRSRYATNSTSDDYMIHYGNLSFDAHFGDSFVDLKRWNYCVGGNTDLFWSDGITAGDIVATYGLRGSVGHDVLSLFTLTLDAGMDYRTYGSSYRNSTPFIGVVANYVGRKWRLRIGFESYMDRVTVSDVSNYNHRLIPRANFDFNLYSTQVIVYASLDGDLHHNDFASLARLNPYLQDGLFFGENSVSRSYSAGVKGGIHSGKVVYDISANYNTINNNVFWAINIENYSGGYANNYFTAHLSNLHTINLNAQLTFMPVKQVDFWVGLDVNRYFTEATETYEIGKPALELKVGGAFNSAKVRFGLDAELISRRKFTQINLFTDYEGLEPQTAIDTAPASVDLGAFAEWSVTKRFVLWGEVNNLLSSSVYQWAHYREYGINGTVGVKVQF